ncbi:MAG: selenocysteine-specific translation elongation factor [Candidatus Obscuribacterales bacterium]|nr:selenocysteine-specific translation elongation factor [Candidatus Obscuribacterales bacterium]
MRYFTVATAGHVDHGKTSLLKALTGIDPDRLKEEKERQMTTDLGFAHLSLDDMVVGFVDVPGHGKFLKNMLAGVGGIDMALLVVAADEGPMPQTIQHVRILSFLGVPNVLVALNKIDTCDSHRIESSRQRIESLLEEYGLHSIGVVPVSAIKETGLAELKESIFKSCAAYRAKQNGKTFFLPIDRVFTKSGFGTVVTGTLVDGELSTGDQVLVGNRNLRAKIRRLESFGKTIDKAFAGQRVAVNLASKENLERGDVLLKEDHTPADVLIVAIATHRDTSETVKTIAGQDIRVYHGTKEAIGHVRFVTGNVAKIAFEVPLIARIQDKLIIRLSDDTILGGSVLLLNPPRWLTKEKLSQLDGFLSDADFEKALLAYLQLSPQGILPISELARFLPPDSSALATLLQGELVQAADSILSEDKQDNLFKSILESLPGTQEAVRSKVLPTARREVFQALVSKLVALGQIEQLGDKLAIVGQKDNDIDSAMHEALRAGVLKILSETMCLEIEELATRLNVDSKVVEKTLTEMMKHREAAIVAYEFAALQETIDKCHRVIADLWQKKKDIAPGEFRQALGTSRKYAMALLTYFDDQQITRRLPSGRVLMKAPS